MLREYFYQVMIGDFGNFEKKSLEIPIRSTTDEMMRLILDDYFSIEIVDDMIVALPVVSGVCVDCPEMWSGFEVAAGPEYETLKDIVIKVCMFYSSAEMSLKLFNVVKRRIAVTAKALECFGLVVTLKELYKNFEKC